MLGLGTRPIHMHGTQNLTSDGRGYMRIEVQEKGEQGEAGLALRPTPS